MGTTDPRVLIDLFHRLGDRIRRTIGEGNELVKGANWLQLQIGEQVSQTEHTARNGLSVSQGGLAQAKETVAAVERVRGEHSDAAEQLQRVTTFVRHVSGRAVAACTHWQNQVVAANRAVQNARANLHAARVRLAQCQQPVYRRGPQGQPVAVYRDCSGCEDAVAVAESELNIAQDHLEACRASRARAEGAEQLVATARPYLSEGETELMTAARAVHAARDQALDSEKAAEAELAAGREAVQHTVAAAKTLQGAEGDVQRAKRDFADGETIARTAEQDLNKRIDSLQLFNRPHPLP